MSPQLHNMLYGFSPREVQMRYDGWRPAVFLRRRFATGAVDDHFVDDWSLALVDGGDETLRGGACSLARLAAALNHGLCWATGARLLELIGFGVLWLTRVTGTRMARLVC